MTTLENHNEQAQDIMWWHWLIPLGTFIFVWWILPIVQPEAPVAWLSSEKAVWYLTRSSGIVAYLLLSLSTAWGLLLSTKLVQRAISPAVSLAMHNYLSWVSLGLIAFHALILLFDQYYTYQLAHIFIPFVGPYRPMWVGAGVISLYLMIITAVSSHFRKQIGTKIWRKLHYLTFGVYLLATIHGLMAGTDVLQLGLMYLISAIVMIYLTAYRVLMTVAPL